MLRILFSDRKGTFIFFTLALCVFAGILCYPADTFSANIISAEYFMDGDPGEGNGISLPPVDAFDSPTETVELTGIDTTGVSVGEHTIYVRFKSSDGVWGLARPIPFDMSFTSPFNLEITGEKWIADAEYFIDADPGAGSGIQILPADGVFNTAEEEFDVSGIEVSAYQPGIHTLYLRLKDSDGIWGVVREYPFEVYEQTLTIAGAEYFIDNENTAPGAGTALLAKDGTFNSSKEEVDTSGVSIASLSDGVHTLYIRFKDSLGRWGGLSKYMFAKNRPLAYMGATPVQPATGDGLIPISVVVSDYSGSNTCKLKVEYTIEDTNLYSWAEIRPGSVTASYGSPVLNNTTEYQIGNALGWIRTSSGPNTISFVWDAARDIGHIDDLSVKFRFTVNCGNDAQAISTESTGLPIDTKSPDAPVLIPYYPDPTGDATPTFRWTGMQDAVRYHLQIATESAFGNIILDEAGITDISYTPLVSLPFSALYWRVSTIDASGNESYFSTADSITISSDTLQPSVSLNYSEMSPVSAGPLTITAVFSEPLATIPMISVDQPGSEDLTPTSMNGSETTWTYTYDAHCADGSLYFDGATVVTITNGFDYAGNANLPAQNNAFTIDTSACGSGNIIAAEYFIDIDPGEGSGPSLPPADGTYDSPEETVELSGINVSGLPVGRHTVYVRFKNADGVWGLSRPIPFDTDFTSPFNLEVTGSKWITAAEYFINNDPGEGNGTHIIPKDGVFDSAGEEFEASGVDISAYPQGMHTLYLRLKDSDGKWGVIREYPFEVYEQTLTIAGAEYFIDNESTAPGSGEPLQAKDGVFNLSREEVDASGISVASLSEGVHTLYIRFKDSLGRWGGLSKYMFAKNRPFSYVETTPVQPATGDGLIPISVIVSDYSGSNTCRLKVEHSLESSNLWDWLTIQEGSVAASYGSPSLDNNADYQIGDASGWIQTSSGANLISFVWDAIQDIGHVDGSSVKLRFTINCGNDAQITSTESSVIIIDTKAPDVPLLVPYVPDPTGDTTPTLRWTGVEGSVRYHLQAATDMGFSEIVIDENNIKAISYTPLVPLPYGNIYWRVRAIDSLGNKSAFSVVDAFTVVTDSERPIVTLSYSPASPISAGPLTITSVFSEPLATVPNISINQPGSVDIVTTAMNGSGATWTYIYDVQCADGSSYIDGITTVSISNGHDYAGHENLPATNNTFTIDTISCGSGNIISAEYFIDIDPGEGSGTSLTPADGAYDSPEETVELSGISTSELSIGNHTVYVRFKSADGIWGLLRPIPFDTDFTSPFNLVVTGEKWIADAEYFIDSDPGEGNGTHILPEDGVFDEAEEELETSSIDISSYPAGMHALYLRLKDSDGKWGVVRQYEFEIYEQTATIAGAEYFIDNENTAPGAGTALPAKDGGFNSSTEEIDVSGISVASLTEGVHTLYIRYKDSQGRWGGVSQQQFIYGDATGDTDGDGMPNSWEVDHGLNPTDPTDANKDNDSDGLTNLDEYLNNTDPNNSDTDGDGMPDGWEVNNGFVPGNPADGNQDLDNDNLLNKDEYYYGTDPKNPDTDGDGMQDGDEVNYGSDPLAADKLQLNVKNKNVLVSLQGNNRIIVGIQNAIGRKKEVQISLDGLDSSWYTIEDKYQNFELIPFEYREIYIQLHLPLNCDITTGQYSFTVLADWLTRKKSGEIEYQGTASDSATLHITPNPNVYNLAIPDMKTFAGNTIFTAWRTDIPATSYLYYRKLGDTDFIQVPAWADGLEHRVMIPDLEYFTYYEVYTENYSACNGYAKSESGVCTS